MNTFFQDVVFGLRVLRKSPGFTLIAVLVLTLTIGGTTAMFTIMNALLLRPIQAKAPERLQQVYVREMKADGRYMGMSYPNYDDMRAKNTVFSDLTAFTGAMCGIGEGDLTRRALVMLVSSNYFSTFGVNLAAGRAFLPEEERPGSAIPVAIVSHNYWRRTGFDPALIGKTIRVNSRALQIVGIAPRHFTGPTAVFSAELWLPLGMYETVCNDFMNESRQGLSERAHHCLMLIGRLKPGMAAAAAEEQLKAIAAQMAEAYPDANKNHTLEMGPINRLSLNESRQADTGPMPASLLMMGMAGVVLLIACLNLANMLLARGSARRKEIAVRLALGSGRGRLVRQLLTEGLLLSFMGGVGGLVVGSWASSLLAAAMGPRLAIVDIVFDPHPDWRVLTVTFFVCVASVLVFALGPAWKLTRADVVSELKEQTGDSLSGRVGQSLFAPRSLLVAGQLALSLALLTAAGLFAHGAVNALRADPGFSLDRSILVETDSSLAGYNETRGRQAYSAILERMRGLPGVEAASLAYTVPFGLVADARDVIRGSAPAGDLKDSKEPKVGSGFNIVTDDYFKTMGLQVLRGREFTAAEAVASGGLRVAIIDEPLASKLWPGLDAVGKQIRFMGNSNVMDVVGVVAGVRNNLGDKTVQPHVYLPAGQEFRSMASLHVRLKIEGAEADTAMLRTVREAFRSADSQMPIISIQTLRHFHHEGVQLWVMKMSAQLFAIFGGLALFLATVGVYGVKAYVVARRTREIGIRMALGATSSNVLWMVLRDGLKLTALGLGVGLILALGVSFLLRSVVYDVQTIDPMAIGMALVSLAASALVACYLPALRATRVQPIFALRYE